MKKREHRATSKAGEVYIQPAKPTHKQKIVDGLEKLKVGGTYEEISMVTGMREDQVWKRMSNLVEDQKVFDTGITRKLKSGLQGIVWQLKGLTAKKGEMPIIEIPKKTKKQVLPTNQQPFLNL